MCCEKIQVKIVKRINFNQISFRDQAYGRKSIMLKSMFIFLSPIKFRYLSVINK